VKKYILFFIAGAIFTSCGSSKKVELTNLSVDLDSKLIDKKESIIYTKKDHAKLYLKSSEGSLVYLNGEFKGRVPRTGIYELSLPIDHIGSTNYKIKIVDEFSDEVQKDIEVIRLKPDAKLGVIKTEGKASGLTLSQNGLVFIAEQSSGVEIMNIGFNDEVSSKKISSISNISATKVILSNDEKSLYIKDEEGVYHKFDLTNINDPVELSVVNEIDKDSSSTNPNKTLRLSVTSCGLVGSSGKDFEKREFLIKDSLIKDAIFIDNTHFLVAHSEDGLWLYRVDEKNRPHLVSKKNLDGDTTGLSLIKKDAILFVANGDKGVEIFNLDILFYEMNKR